MARRGTLKFYNDGGDSSQQSYSTAEQQSTPRRARGTLTFSEMEPVEMEKTVDINHLKSRVDSAKKAWQQTSTISADGSVNQSERDARSNYKTLLKQYKTLKAQQDAEEQTRKAQQEYDELRVADLNALKAKMDAAKESADGSAKERVVAGSIVKQKDSGAQAVYEEAARKYNLAQQIQYDERGAAELRKLSEDQAAAVETLARSKSKDRKIDMSGYGMDDENRYNAKQKLLADGFTEQEISDLEDWRARQIDSAKYDKAVQKREKLANSGPIGAAAATVASVPETLMSGIGLIDLAMQVAQNKGTDRPVNYKRTAMLPYAKANAARSTISGNLEQTTDAEFLGQNVASGAYNIGTSMLDSAATLGLTALGIPPMAATSLLGGAAATSAMVDAHERGVSDEQAVLTGAAAGVAETLFEEVSLEKLLSLKPVRGDLFRRVRTTLKNIGLQAATEGSEEVFTTLANTVTDHLINGSLSEMQQNIKAYMDSGMTEGEARARAYIDLGKQLSLDFTGGAISGGIMSGVRTGIETAKADARLREDYGAKPNELIEEGLATDDGSKAFQLAQKYRQQVDGGKNMSSGQVGKLVRANEAYFLAEDEATVQSAVKQRLMELGETGDIEKISRALTRQASGEDLTIADRRRIARSEAAQQISHDLNPKNENDWAKGIGTAKLNRKAYNAELVDLAARKAARTEAQMAAQASVERRTDSSPAAPQNRAVGRTGMDVTSAETGELLGSVKIQSIKDGKMTLKTEDGQIVDADRVKFRTEGERVVYSTVAEMNLNPAIAQSIVDNYDNSADGRVYAADVKLAYQYGKMNFPKSELEKLDIKPYQAEHAYNLGRAEVRTEQPKQDVKVAGKKRTVSGGKGKVVLETSTDEKAMTDIQRESLSGIKLLAELSNVEFHVYESTKSGDSFVYEKPDGVKTTANGWYVTGTNQIWVDLNAGNAGEGTMLYTAAHEISHYIKQWSPTKWRAMADYLIEQYGEDVPLDALLERQMEKLRARNPGVADEKLMDEAHEELVADALSEMLVDGKVVEKLAALKKKDRSLWTKIKDAVKDLLERWGVIRKQYEGRTPDAGEAQFLRGMDEAFSNIQTMYAEAFADADANFSQAMQEVVKPGAAAISESEILTDGAVVTDGETRHSIRSMKADIAEGQMFEDLKERCGWSQKQVDELRSKLTEMVAYMEPHREILDMNEAYGREGRRYSPYKPNSDPLYDISMDFSTLCSKRLLTQYVIESLQVREGRPMSAEEQMAIRDMLNEYRQVEKGLQVACAMCYVEAARLKSPKQIQRWIDDPAACMRAYFGAGSKAFKAKIKEAQGDFKVSRGYDRNAVKSQMTNKDRTELNKIGPRMKAEYQVGPEEQKIIDRAASLPKETYLTAANLARLRETDPVIYKAYAEFVRNATRAKALETDEPYYYGDSARDNGNGIKVSDKFIEKVNRENGMRFSSWSDWRIQHMLDYITAVIDNSVRGAAMHGYTKFPDEVRVLGKTGMMFNLSGVAGTQTGLNPDGSLSFSDTESINIEEAKALREEFPETAGLQCIGVSDEHIRALMRSEDVDYIIPYHTSSLNKDLRRMAQIHGWKDYTGIQNAGKIKSAKNNGENNWQKEPVFSEFFVGYDTGLSGVEAMRESAKRYVEMCGERGLRPKFEKFADEPNYWKLLIDRKMINQKTGELIRQKPVTPTFDWGVIRDVVDRYVANYDGGMEARALKHVVDNWDTIPQRIRDLKAGKAKRAVDTVGSEMLAAQPKEGAVSGTETMPDVVGTYGDGKKYSERVTDKDTLDFLENQDTITTYKTMQFVDGKLYPPMAARVNGKYEDESVLGQWEQAVEHPELVDSTGKFKLDKGVGQGSLKAAYNPYMHSSNLVLNDQFSGAYARPQLVTVECEVPASEATSGYHALYAKDAVGWHAWHTGTVAGQVRKARGIERQVFLSRWIKPVRIVPDSEVARMYKDILADTGVEVPDNVVPPSLLAELKKVGVPIKASGKVKFSTRDSAGRELTAAQQDYFRDSKARDANGNLLVLYHGTVSDFNVFDRSKIGTNWEYVSDLGFYFTPYEEDAVGYARTTSRGENIQVKQVYLNLKNPLIVEDSGWGDAAAQADIRHGDLKRWAKEGGHDGIIVRSTDELMDDDTPDTVYIAFESKQIKNVTNQNPTEDADIRYSERGGMSNREILASVFMDAAKNEIERGKIREYQSKIEEQNTEEAKLHEVRAKLKEVSFSPGKKDKAKISQLRDEATKLANRISIRDKQLLRLEASKPLMAVLEREKDLAYKRASAKWGDRVEKMRTGRSKTEMRHKVQKIAGKLNQLLLNGDKEHNVKIGLQKATAEALSAINMETTDVEARLAKLQRRIDKASDPAERAKLLQTYERVEQMGANMTRRLSALKDAYDDIKDSTDPLIANAYQPEIDQMIKDLRDTVGDTPLHAMSLQQLKAVYDTYTAVLTTIRKANKAFKMERNATISGMGEDVMREIRSTGGNHPLELTGAGVIKDFGWSLLKPVYAFKMIGSDTLIELFDNVRAGEDTWAVDVSEAKSFYADVRRKYHYDKWDLEKAYTFHSKTGKEFRLNLGQIMSLYAYSKRKAADEHLDKGGFVFERDSVKVVEKKKGVPLKYTVKISDAYNLSIDQLSEICGTLTSEQAKFVDEMQTYLSDVMGEKGNEVALEMYGIKLFTEKNYFPLKSARQFMYEKNDVSQETRIKNSGFTKKTVPHASNPVILSDFMSVWAKHVSDMAMYHAFVLPLEDFNRVFNYRTRNDAETDLQSVKATLQNAYGRQSEEYIKQLLTDLNGGARSDPHAGFINKSVSLFKKAATFASASVVIQQPSAIARAFAYIDPKYFKGKPGIRTWDELKKYAPVAVIKEMGYFDTNMGRSTEEYITGREYEGIKEKMSAVISDPQYRDEVLGKAPALADELAWCQIWQAVQNEIADKQGLTGEALKQAAGKRFTEVVVNTQVYDSVLSRNGIMRSKDTGAKMATAFMAEPITSLNMIADAIVKGKRGDKKFTGRAIGAVAASIILNSILVAFVYAMRNDDDDKSFAEKYAKELTESLIDGFNPGNMIPFVRDIISIFRGYDVERSDMSIVSNIYKGWKNLWSSNRTPYRKVEDFAGAVASVFGLPVKNIMRDARGMYTMAETLISGERTTGRGLGEAVLQGLGSERKDSDQLYSALMSGDTKQAQRIKERYGDERKAVYAVRDGLYDNDKRITQAAQARVDGNQSEYLRIAKEIVAEKHFTQDEVVRAINYAADKLRKGESESSAPESPDTFKIEEYYDEIMANDQAEAAVVKKTIIEDKVRKGKSEDEAAKSFKSSFKKVVKNAFEDGEIDSGKAQSLLVSYGDQDEAAAKADVAGWQFARDYPDQTAEDSWFDAYYKYVADSGVQINTYMQYRDKVRSITGKGRKEARMAVIDSLPISSEQKDALYYSEGWAASTIGDAPWH